MTDTQDAEEGARQSAFRAGYRTGFGDGFEAADKVHEAAADATKDKVEAKKAGSDKPAEDKSDGGEDEGAKKRNGSKPPLYKRPLVVLVAIAVVIAAIVAATLFFLHARSHETTDDAFVDGQASQIAAQAAGRVTALHIVDNQQVKRGDPLVDIDAADVQAKVDQAQAGLLTAQGQREQAVAQVAGQQAGAAQDCRAARG